MKIIGHRGAKGLAPENTLASFAKALEHGVDEIELDVRVTSDDVCVLSHDVLLSDPAGNHLAVSEHSYKELKAHKPDLTTLEEALSFINQRVAVGIEIKRTVPVEPVVKIVKQFLNQGWVVRYLSFRSYSLPILLELKKAFPDIELIPLENWSGVRAGHRARLLGSTRISMLEIWLWPGFIRAIRHSGYELDCFPNKSEAKQRFFARLGLGGASNDPKKARRWARAGLAGVITDYPDRFEKH